MSDIPHDTVERHTPETRSAADATIPERNCGEETPPRRSLRLLTRNEYHNTVHDLLPGLVNSAACETVAECAYSKESCIANQCVKDPCGLHTFTLALAPGTAQSVHVSGNFNAWAMTAEDGGVPMNYVPELGRWIAKHPLATGEWQYKFVIDGAWTLDPENPQTADNGLGGENSVVSIDCAATPGPNGAPPSLIDLATPTATFPVESSPAGFHFDNHADSALVTSVHLDAYFEAGRILSEAGFPLELQALPCTPDEDATACARLFVETFGLKAFRRPLTGSEVERYQTQLLAASSFEVGMRTVMHTMLTSPYFLYRFELGVPKGDGTFALTSYERASALSYFLWGTMPDAELLSAASTGQLDTSQGLRTQAERLLFHPRAREALGRFAVQWLGIQGITQVNRNATLFPEFDHALAQAMLDETKTFVNHVVFEGTGQFKELFTANYSFVNDLLAPVYNLTLDGDNGWQQAIALSIRQAGLLAHASVLTSTAHSDQTSPIRRGLFVRERLLCQSLGVPPANAGGVPEVDPTATTKERFRQHTEDPFCASCHVYIDELGFGFERFDPIGSYRLVENGVEIEPDGNMNDIEGLGTNTDALFTSLPELGALLSSSTAAQRCFVKHVTHYAWGRFDRLEDACTQETLYNTFRDSDGTITDLILAVIESEAFVLRTDKPTSAELN